MKVTKIAQTYTLTSPGIEDWMGLDLDAENAEDLIEFAGRSCYQSFRKPNPKTAKNADYIANIVAQGHFSVLEHASVTFYIEAVSRALTHELIRHRHLSFSELSQRFVNIGESEYVAPPVFDSFYGSDPEQQTGERVYYEMYQAVETARWSYAEIEGALSDAGVPRKQAREAARAVMPNATETKIVVTGNLRAWRDFLGKRYHVAADAEIRELATEILRQLRDVAPSVFADFPEEPLS